ncbi:GNAT family N-acetyltransferase [Hahella sp. HN01]|uniref:GNAT family N-acetyltransferase n=1 Tax=Hahella sp. HN01 TaxID=2847262 RepID=UPI001C1F014D|nr:GNAT family N-acetyltransferase [Hahella sp. HN01]MBU6955841.1 GNAT family N-acetyltransferase [Hahella sp. HN01]
MPSDNPCVIRPARLEDGPRLLSMMRQLAEFEGYAEDFAVTLKELERRLFVNRDFGVYVAESDGLAVGMLVYYSLPFTYDLTPWIYVKELFIEQQYRYLGLGGKLMTALARECLRKGGRKIRWDVLTTNEPAAMFYRSQGAKCEDNWRIFSLNASDISKLAGYA